MEGKVSYTIVGLFVIILTSAIVLSIIWLSSGFSFQTYKQYQVYMQESVSGLTMDSAVEFNGVKVGEVKNIAIDSENPRLVNLLLKIRSNVPVTVATVAKLQSRGMTGVTFVALSDTSADLTPLVAKEGQKYPVIQTAPSLFFRLDSAVTSLTKNFEKVAKALLTLLDEQNLHSIKEILANTKTITKELDFLVHSSSSTINTIQNQTLPAAYRLFNNLDVMSKNLADVSTELKQNPSVLLRGKNPPKPGPGEKK